MTSYIHAGSFIIMKNNRIAITGMQEYEKVTMSNDDELWHQAIDLEHLTPTQRYLKRVDDQVPGLTYLGFGFWLSWIVAFMSGSIWIDDLEVNAWLVSDLFMFSLSGLALVLLIFAVFSERLKPYLFKNGVMVTSAAIASACTASVVLSANGILPCPLFFDTPALIAGITMGMLFLRSAPLYSALAPKRAMFNYAASGLFACAFFFFLMGVPRMVSRTCFVALPLASVLLFLIRFYPRNGEDEALVHPAKIPNDFWRFIIAVFIYAIAARFTQATFLTSLPVSETALCSTYMMIALAVFSVALIVLMLTVPKTLDFGRLYYLIILLLIASLVFAPFLQLNSVSVSALGSFAAHSFAILFWCMLAYIVFQMKCDPIKVFGYGCALYYFGSIIGNLIGIGMVDFRYGETAYYAACAIVAFACIIGATVVFPEGRIKAMLEPIDEELLEPSIREKKIRAGHWINAAREIADEFALTNRETEVLLLLARGKTAEQISERLTVSFYTTRAHIRNIYAKLGVHSRPELNDLIERKANEA